MLRRDIDVLFPTDLLKYRMGRTQQFEAIASFELMSEPSAEMDKPSDLTERSKFTEPLHEEYVWIERRLELVYRFKKHFDQSPRISQEHMDFVNGFLWPYEMNSLIRKYEAAIQEVTNNDEKVAREKVLRQLKRCD